MAFALHSSLPRVNESQHLSTERNRMCASDHVLRLPGRKDALAVALLGTHACVLSHLELV